MVLGPLQKEQFSKVNVHAMIFFLGQKISSIKLLKNNNRKIYFFLSFVMTNFFF
jgi:hypothetical protein